jgi:multidrug efflux pump
MFGLINAALSRTRTVFMIFALLLIAGWTTYNSIPKEANPDITIPIIYVSISHDGISPQDAERMLVRPMENELRSIEGVKEMKATASEGHASITLEFIAGLDASEALANVRDRVTLAKAKLPDETEEPTIKQITMADQNPVLTVILSGPITERGLVTLARGLQDKIEGMKQVLEVEIGGDREDILEVIVDPMLLESYGLDQNDILRLLSRNNALVTAGTMDNGKGRFAVKVPAVFESLEDIYSQPVKVDGDKIITFKDVANVRRAYRDPTGFARLNSKRAVSLEVKKRPGENIIDTVDQVKVIVEQAREMWPEQIRVTYTGDQSGDVRDMLRDLQNNVTSAVLLVVIVIIAILGMRTAALVGIAIPGSFLSGILVLSIFGLTVNIVVLFALIMAVGMLVDGAIVVTEFADRLMSEGKPRKEAYLRAAQRMAWPITASTATTLAAFAPLIFWPGIMGEFMKFLPITLIATLTASLFMALIFVPSLGAVFGKARPLSPKQSKQMLQAEHGDLTCLSGFTGKYVRTLSAAIKHPWKVLASAFVIAILVFGGYGMSGLGAEFFPEIEPEGMNITVRSHGDLSIIEQDNIMKSVEALIKDMPEIKTLYSRTGGRDQVGTIRVNLVDWQLRRKADQLVTDIHQKTANLSGVEVEVRKDENGPGGGKALVLELSSRFPDKLSDAVRKIRGALQNDAQFVNVTDSSPRAGIEWELAINRADAARFGADAALVGSTVRMVTNGLKVAEYRPDDVDDELDILIRFPEDKRDINRLDQLRLKTIHGLVPIGNLVERLPVQKVDSINRVDSRRVLTISADMAPGAQLGKALPRLKQQLPGLGIDPSVSFVVKGENQEQAESQGFLINAFKVALFIMAVILVTQFNSFYQALLILSAVLFSTVGVFLGLLIVQKPFGIVMSGIGVIALAGIVVNNNIVLIDTYNVLRKQGLNAVEAVIRTGAQRLRPVMLTTVTTILGLMPMVMEMNIDFMRRSIEFGAPSTQWWSQLATAVAGGLAFSTLLTLVLTPCLLVLGANMGEKYRVRKADKQQKVENKLKTAA